MVASLQASLKNGLLWGLFPVLWTGFLVLLLLNDVKLNPGPVRFPCSVCYKSVRVNRRALQCHCVFCGVDYRSYVAFQNAVAFNWLCPKCVADVMPFHDCSTLNSSSGTLDSCSSLSTSSNGTIQYDLPSLSSPAGL